MKVNNMKLTKDAEVFSSDGEKIGSLDRVVLDPDTMVVTHMVIKEGVLFTTDKVVPIHYLNREVGEQIILNKTAEDLEKLPPYDKSSYVSFDQKDYPTDKNVDAVYWYPPIRVTWWALGSPLQYPKPKFVKKEKVIPAGKVALDEGAEVISRDGNAIGKVERVIVEPEENRATHIVVGGGLPLMKEHKLVPTLWVKDVTEDKIHLSVRSSFFERLPEHELVA